MEGLVKGLGSGALVLLLALGPKAPAVSLPVLGTWSYHGTAPAGFVAGHPEIARLTITQRHGRLSATILTGRHRYAATAQYTAARHELRLVVRTSAGFVRLVAVVWQGNTRMLGTWYDRRGDDGGFVLVRVNPAPHKPAPQR